MDAARVAMPVSLAAARLDVSAGQAVWSLILLLRIIAFDLRVLLNPPILCG